MTLSTVEYEYLRSNIQNLTRDYSNCLARFSINNPNKDAINVAGNSLVILLARVNQHVIQCKTDRVTARNVFTTLTAEVRPFITGTPQEIKRATLYLLGGLIHRFLRIETEYYESNKSSYNLFSWISSSNLWDVNNCGLYTAIKRALAISDSNKLDVYTIINALEVFRENMYMMVEVEQTVDKEKKKVEQRRYKMYEHFNKVDPNFEKNLDAMINTQKEKGSEVIRQFNAINFLQSLMNALDRENQPVELEIIEWCKNLAKTHKDFSVLNRESIDLHLNQYFQSKTEKSDIKEHMLFLLDEGFTNKAFEMIKDHNRFLEEMKTCNTDASRSICCGAYILLLKEGNLDIKLATLLTSAFGFSEKLTTEVQIACLKALKHYVGVDSESNDDDLVINKDLIPQLNYDFFPGGWKTMVSQTTQLLVSLGESTALSFVM